MNFGAAIAAIEAGKRVSRSGWNGKGMWIGLVAKWDADIGYDHGKMLPFLYMRTAQGDIVPWLASQTDMLAQDYSIYREALTDAIDD